MQKCQVITTPQMQPESLSAFIIKIVVALNDLALPGILKVVIKQQHLSIWTRQWDDIQPATE